MERHFSEQQVSEIIRKATENQARDRPAGTSAPTGISEIELKRVANELGIDEESLQLAISEVGSGGLGDTGTLNSISRILERSVEGDLSADDVSVVLQEFTPSAEIGSHSPVSAGNSISYQSVVGLGLCRVNVTSGRGRTTLRVKSNAGLAALATLLPAFILSMITNIISWEQTRLTIEDFLLFAILLSVLFLSAGYFGFRMLVRGCNRKVLELVNRSATKLAESADHLRGRLAKSGIPLPDVGENVDSPKDNLAETGETRSANRAENRQDRARD